MKRVLTIVCPVSTVLVGFFVYKTYGANGRPVSLYNTNIDHVDATYSIADKKVTLMVGFSEVETSPAFASKITVRYFANEARI